MGYIPDVRGDEELSPAGPCRVGQARGVEDATREAEARAGEQVRRECEERERRRRLAERRALLHEERLETLKRCTEEALAHEGVEHTHLGYDMLVKLKRDALLERESMRMDVEDHWEPLEGATADPRTR
jgi:hypothetical protein